MRRFGITIKTQAVAVRGAPHLRDRRARGAGSGGHDRRRLPAAARGGDGGPATSASLSTPASVLPTADGGFLVSEQGTNRVRTVAPGGTITTLATGLSGATGMAQLPDGSILVATVTGHRVRRIAPNGTVTTFAGTGTSGFSGDGGSATSAQLNQPWDVAVRADGSVLIADTGNHRIRRVDPAGNITTVVGDGTPAASGDGGPASAAQTGAPRGVQVTSDGGYLIGAGDNHLRKVDAFGTITTIAGNGPGFSQDGGQAVDSAARQPDRPDRGPRRQHRVR